MNKKVILFLLYIIAALSTLFFVACGSCGSDEESNNNGNNGNGGANGTGYESSAYITGKIPSEELDEVALLMPDPIPQPEEGVNVRVIGVSLIGRSDVYNSIADVDSNGEFTLEVPVDEDFFTVVVIDDGSSLFKYEGGSSLTPLGMIKFEKEFGWDSTLNFPSDAKDKKEDAGTLDYDPAGGFFKANSISSTILSEVVSNDEEESSKILVDDAKSYDLTLTSSGDDFSTTITTEEFGEGISFSEQYMPDFCTLTDNGDDTATIKCTPDSSNSGKYTFVVYATKDGSSIKTDITLFVKRITEVYKYDKFTIQEMPVNMIIDGKKTEFGTFIAIGTNEGNDIILKKFDDGDVENAGLGATFGYSVHVKTLFTDNFLVIAYASEIGKLSLDIIDLETGMKVKSSTIEEADADFTNILLFADYEDDSIIIVYHGMDTVSNMTSLATRRIRIAKDSNGNYTLAYSAEATIGAENMAQSTLYNGNCVKSGENDGRCMVVLDRMDSKPAAEGFEFTFDSEDHVLLTNSSAESTAIDFTGNITNATSQTGVYLDSNSFLFSCFPFITGPSFRLNLVYNATPQGLSSPTIEGVDYDDYDYSFVDMLPRSGTSAPIVEVFQSLTVDTDSSEMELNYIVIDPFNSYEVLYSSKLVKKSGNSAFPYRVKPIMTDKNVGDFILLYVDYNTDDGYILNAIW